MDQNIVPNQPKFRGKMPRVLLLTSQYFIMGELVAAMERLGVPHRLLDLAAKEMDLQQFVELMTTTLAEFKPDVVLTVNHLGVDREGVLMSILNQLKVPLASWFVDNPHLILDAYNNLDAGRTILFTWDADTVESLADRGFEAVHHLPLGTDPHRFRPEGRPVDDALRARVSFVGNSMKKKTELRFVAARPSFLMVEKGFDIAEGFVEAEDHTVREYMRREWPQVLSDMDRLPRERALAFETYLTWLATCLYRRECIMRIMPYEPLLVGDDGWTELFKRVKGWRYHRELAYYDELPDFYLASDINFNCTSKQMKGACNQRVFDVPCCGAFLLTDHRDQIEDLFEPGREVVFYKDMDEIPALMDKYLNDAEARQRVAAAARKRVLAEHTYDHRVCAMLELLNQTIG
ncbi:CgeB family protein [Salidesulfovibrio onnuriiensis]|uniref:CgeB family protein n=1 Tax=Salidesulfovibrio onnuriiensis TaxID=2583823 RepID=UPI0011CA7890|nr:glycosyltransferase [Salidesulfovibrio onnuriiensis]